MPHSKYCVRRLGGGGGGSGGGGGGISAGGSGSGGGGSGMASTMGGGGGGGTALSCGGKDAIAAGDCIGCCVAHAVSTRTAPRTRGAALPALANRRADP